MFIVHLESFLTYRISKIKLEIKQTVFIGEKIKLVIKNAQKLKFHDYKTILSLKSQL